jgi:DNA-binding PadR family transcriptional regulator
MGKGEHLGEFEQVALLAVARLGDDAHGAVIHREIHDRTGRDVSAASVYVTLARLERKGYVDAWSAPGTSDRGGRPRRMFHLTPSGVAELRAVRRAQARLWEGLAFDPLDEE